MQQRINGVTIQMLEYYKAILMAIMVILLSTILISYNIYFVAINDILRNFIAPLYFTSKNDRFCEENSLAI